MRKKVEWAAKVTLNIFPIVIRQEGNCGLNLMIWVADNCLVLSTRKKSRKKKNFKTCENIKTRKTEEKSTRER